LKIYKIKKPTNKKIKRAQSPKISINFFFTEKNFFFTEKKLFLPEKNFFFYLYSGTFLGPQINRF